ncbi:hypothetical protein AB3S75_038692 [Citrus x aurantiifolia]
MTDEDFISSNGHINGGNDLPREFLSELYHSICKNEIGTTPEQGAGFPEMTQSCWIDLMRKSKKTAPFIVADGRAYLDRDVFATCRAQHLPLFLLNLIMQNMNKFSRHVFDGFLADAKIPACHHLGRCA